MKESDSSLIHSNQIQVASYEAGFKNSSSLAKGVLMRLNIQGVWGYSSLQPWTHLGDPKLDLNHINDILKSDLGQRALELAHLDAQARLTQKKLLEDLPAYCHYSVLDFNQVNRADLEEALKVGYTHVKVKFGSNIEENIQWLKSVWDLNFLKWRFDFNNQLNEKLWESFCLELPDFLISKIEFVEDPFIFNEKTWKQAQRILPLALDFQLVNSSKVRELVSKECAEYFIYKPSARMLPQGLEQKIVITSYMDHPIGVAHALAEYQKLKKQRVNMSVVSGLGTLSFFQDSMAVSKYIHQLHCDGPLLTIKTSGFGVGFEEALEQESWQDIESLMGVVG